jgi:hypothetical protein
MKRKGTAIASETETAETEGGKSNASESALNACAGQEIRWPIVRLAGEWGVSEPTLYRILVGAGLDGAKGFELIAAAKLTVAHFRDKAEANGKQGEEAATRRKIADADAAEVNLQASLRKFINVDEGRRMFESVWVTARERVRALQDLTPEQKNAVCEILCTELPILDASGD